jgi:ribose-phosphate pyrophosphokinase
LIIRDFDSLFTKTQYPSGETHLKMIEHAHSPTDVVLCPKVRDWNGLMDVINAKYIVDRTPWRDLKPDFVVPYFPFARDDRRNSFHDAFELEMAVALAKSTGIIIVDPHSDVSGMLHHYSQAQVVAEAAFNGFFDNGAIVAIPDVGAAKKVSSWLSVWNSYVPTQLGEEIQCLKKRDPETGRLSGFKAITDELYDTPVTIVDDICDGGGTFIGLAEELKNKGAGQLKLLVTHGLFTKGLHDLLNTFDEIWTLDIYPQAAAYNRVKYINTHDLIERNMPL